MTAAASRRPPLQDSVTVVTEFVTGSQAWSVTVAPTAAPGRCTDAPPRTQRHPALFAVPPRSAGATRGVGT